MQNTEVTEDTKNTEKNLLLLFSVLSVSSVGPYRNSVGESLSMSSKVWFSPAMAQMKRYAPVPQPQCIDQLGDSTACSLCTNICLVASGRPRKCTTTPSLGRSK